MGDRFDVVPMRAPSLSDGFARVPDGCPPTTPPAAARLPTAHTAGDLLKPVLLTYKQRHRARHRLVQNPSLPSRSARPSVPILIVVAFLPVGGRLRLLPTAGGGSTGTGGRPTLCPFLSSLPASPIPDPCSSSSILSPLREAHGAAGCLGLGSSPSTLQIWWRQKSRRECTLGGKDYWVVLWCFCISMVFLHLQRSPLETVDSFALPVPCKDVQKHGTLYNEIEKDFEGIDTVADCRQILSAPSLGSLLASASTYTVQVFLRLVHPPCDHITNLAVCLMACVFLRIILAYVEPNNPEKDHVYKKIEKARCLNTHDSQIS